MEDVIDSRTAGMDFVQWTEWFIDTHRRPPTVEECEQFDYERRLAK